MKHLFLLPAVLFCATAATAQNAEVFRAEFTPFDTRESAVEGDRSAIERYIPFSPQEVASEGGVRTVGQVVELPLLWTDRDIYLHLEETGAAYTLWINDAEVARIEDPVSPREFRITDYLRPGRNALLVELRESRTPELQAATPASPRAPFANSYITFQHRVHIDDFRVRLEPDSTQQFGILRLDVVASNSYPGPDSLSVGYDIYDPQGKLHDFGVHDLHLAGRSRDTLRLERPIYGTNANAWADGRAPLYRVTLYTKRAGMLWEYIPLEVGFGRTEYRDGAFWRFGKRLDIRPQRYNAAADEAATLREIKALKAQGINTLCPDAPQPAWFYTLCDRQGMWVVDRANLNAPARRGDRTVGGTPSNDPALCDEYLSRVKALHARSRNHTCILAYALGGESGNGYNMYKAYQWLKSVERDRPVFYVDAAGEWNSDDTLR